MRRDIYLDEYESMTFKERFYIYRKNRMAVSVRRLNPGNPLDWSVRKALKGLRNAIGVPIYLILYLPVAISGANHLKTAYVNNKWKRSTHHKDMKVIK